MEPIYLVIDLFSLTVRYIAPFILYSILYCSVHSLKRYLSAKKWDWNTIFVMFYSLNFLQPVHVQSVHLLIEYTPYNDMEQNKMSSGLLLMEYHWGHVLLNFSDPSMFLDGTKRNCCGIPSSISRFNPCRLPVVGRVLWQRVDILNMHALKEV